MSLVDKINSKLDEMSFTRKKAIDKLDGLQMQIAFHLIKVFLDFNSRDKNKWVKELNGWRLQLVNKNRGKNGSNNLPFDILFNGLWEEPLGEKGDREFRLSQLADDGFKLDGDLESPLFKDFVIKCINSIINKTKFIPKNQDVL